MANASTLINSFNAGEISPTLDFRSDLDKYYSGCKQMENFMPLLEGGAENVLKVGLVGPFTGAGAP